MAFKRQTITNFQQAQAALRPLYQNARTLYNLDTMRTLMAHVGNPQNKLTAVHIAGTSGKTSTTYYVAVILKAQGLQVGHTVSPHVDSINERLQINGQPLPEAEFCALLDEFLQIVKTSGVQPSYFETLAAMAYWEFARRGVDYAVIEVGMGGEMDATNVIDLESKVAVITDIGLDHTHILGNTLAEISWYKAGIIMPKNQVVMYEQGADVMGVVEAQVAKQQASLLSLPASSAIELPGLPLFQQRNLGLAVATVNYINQRDGRPPLTEQHIQAAAKLQVPARLERFSVQGKTVITDGSHNKQKTEALLRSIKQLYPGVKPAILCGFVAGNAERWQEALDVLIAESSMLYFTTFSGEQDLPRASVTVDNFTAYCDQIGFSNYQVIADPQAALDTLLQRPEELLLVTGSFYLLNHIRPQLNP